MKQRRKKTGTMKRAVTFFMALSLAVTSGAGVSVIPVQAEQSEVADEVVYKLDMDETGYLTPAKESLDLENRVFSWDNATVYFVLTDRFKNSDKSNDHSYGRGFITKYYAN